MNLLNTLLEDMNIDNWQATPNTRYGSNEGGIHIDADGNKHYAKFYKNPEQARTEYAATKLHKLFGVKTLDADLVTRHGKLGISTKWNKNVEVEHPYFYHGMDDKHQGQLAKMYHAAVILNNRDIVGMEHDNIVHDKKTGDLISIDHGGSMNFRAMGGHKEFGDDIPEKESLLHYQPSAEVFKANLTKENLSKSLDHIKKVKDDDIRKIMKSSGLPNHEELANTIINRKNNLIQQGV